MAILTYHWLSPPSNLTLSNNDVHVWRAKLDILPLHNQLLLQTLSSEERMRAKHFHFEKDRKRFIASRGILRTILGFYLDTEPSQLQFCYGPYGKPYLEDESGDSKLQFNLAHSCELALYAFTRNSEIGVDLEYIRYIPHADQIATRFFSAHENAVLRALPTGQKQKAFFNCWTRKEAYIKAVGNGLAQPLDKFDVSFAPGERACLLNVEGHPEEASRWSLKALKIDTGYVAALVVEGRYRHLAYWQFPESK